MEKDFVQLDISCNAEQAEILIAELAELGFDSFEETEKGLLASVLQEQYDAEAVHQIMEQYQVLGKIDFTVETVERINWNEEWEKNYEPIQVLDRCYVRATFHAPKPEFPYEIVINPKMSFGTGHHATTWLMLKQLLDIELYGKMVIDIGCGTAILAIMAALKGASRVDAFDIDDWSVENAAENFELNKVKAGFLEKGTIATVQPKNQYDIVLANINRNVLLEEMAEYAKIMKKGAILLLSGFYEADIEVIQAECKQHQLEFQRSEIKDDWAVCVFVKN